MIELIEMYRENELEIESLKLRKDICNDEIDNWGAASPDDKRAYLGKKQDFLTRISQTDNTIDELNLINKRIEVLENRQREIKELISKFEGIENKILELKLIEGFNLQQIAIILGYSEQHIRRKHAEIMKRINFKL